MTKLKNDYACDICGVSPARKANIKVNNWQNVYFCNRHNGKMI